MGVKDSVFVNNEAPQCDADYLNSVRAEVNNFITSIGETPILGDANQLGSAVTEAASGTDFYTDSGIADAYVLTVIGLKNPVKKYFNGMKVRFLPGNINTGTSTVNVSTLGVKNIKGPDGTTDITAGEIPENIEVRLTYDGTNFRLVARADTMTSVSATTTVEGIVELATDAETETGTDTTRALTPSNLASYRGIVKASINFDGTGTISINDSFNVSSIVDNGVGDYTINFTNSFANINYTVAGFARDISNAAGAGDSFISQKLGDTKTVSAFQVRTVAIPGVFIDSPEVSVMFFGDLA